MEKLHTAKPTQAERDASIAATKQLRQDLDVTLQTLKEHMGIRLNESGEVSVRSSRERSLAMTKLQEAIMWLGMDLKAINEESPGASPNPYPESYNPDSPVVEPTADGLKM